MSWEDVLKKPSEASEVDVSVGNETIEVSAMIDGQLKRKRYSGYSKEEAERMFRDEYKLSKSAMDVLKKPFKEDPDEMTDFMNVSPRMKMAKLERQILREIEKEGGALGMKNLKQFADEDKLKEVLSSMEKEGKIFMHKDGDIYTHEPKK